MLTKILFCVSRKVRLLSRRYIIIPFTYGYCDSHIFFVDAVYIRVYLVSSVSPGILIEMVCLENMIILICRW